LTLAELASLTSIDASSFYLAAGISAAWTLDTAQPGAAQSPSVSVASIAGNAVNFYFNAPSGSWTGVESVANPVNPQVTGQSVVVYTYAALKAALQNAAYSYIEFGANLSYTGTSTTEAPITIAPNRADPELTLNAKGYTFRTTRTGNNVIRFTGTTANSNLTRVVYQDWNVPEHLSSYGLFYGSGTRAVTLVFDGLTFAGPQLADLSANSNLTLDGTRTPVDITITRPGNTGDAAGEVADAGSGLVFRGAVSVIRENTTGATSLFTGFKSVTAGADADVFVEDKRASGLFASGTPAFTLERGASFTYRANRRFTSSNLSSLTVGEDAAFDLRASGAIDALAPHGLLRVGGNLTIENNATFVVVSENNSAVNTLPAVYTAGNISITNPRSLLVYQSGASASARAWGFSTGRVFSYTGIGLARWDTVQGAVPPGVYAPANGHWTNWDGSPLTITGATATNGTFTKLSATGYDGSASAPGDFAFGGKVISDVETSGVERYAIQYWLRDESGGSPAETQLALPEERGYVWPGQSFNIYFPSVNGCRRAPDQPTSGVYAPGTQTIRAYYEPLDVAANPIELEKTAVRLGGTEWEITLTIDSNSETYTPAVDTDIMLVLDRSSSMLLGRRIAAVRTAAIELVDALTANERLLGQIRIGVVQFSNNNATSSKLVLPLTAIRDAGAAVPEGAAAVTDAIAAVFSSTDGLTYINLGIDHGHNELYHSPRTNPYSSKHMVLLSDGEATNLPAARASAAAYKAHAGAHTDGRLMTIGLETTTAATNLLREIQNAGYYSASDSTVSEVFAHIADDIIISALLSGVVADPVGAGFEFRSTTGTALPAGALG
ncbi:MAG: VWA domain-containing protein, partial [Oscillospiraceae bacterium]|nr:VWA domain-containing protein [Oscillospiraceae bacterium]